MSRVIFFSHKKIFEKGKNSAADIRFWEMAKLLANKGHKVTMAEKQREREETNSSIKFIGWKKALLSNIAEQYDVAIVPIWTTEKEVLEKIKEIPVVVDAYAPIVLEQASIYAKKRPDEREISDFTNYVLTSSNVLLSMADFVMCAGNRQKQYYSGIMSALGRINPYSYNENLVDSVPSGIPSRKPIHKKDILKNIVGKNKKIVLWPSSIFPWFDAETAIKAIEIVSKKEKDAVLVFLGATGSSVGSLGYEGAENAKKLAEKDGVLNKNVFFVDRIPYEEMESAYLESEIALITYPLGFETEFALRTRTIHCMWAGLPVICSEGDELAETIKKEGMGLGVNAKEPKKLAGSILELLGNSRLKNEIARKGQVYSSKNFLWEKVCQPLEKFCRKPHISESKNTLTPYSIINEKNELIKNLQEYIEEYKAKNGILDQIIKKNEEEIEERKKTIDEVSDEIRNLREQIKKVMIEREEEVKRINKDFKKQTEKSNQEIQKRDKVIEEQKENFKTQIEQLNQEIQKRDKNREEEIKRINQDFKKQTEQLNQEIQKRDKTIQEQQENFKKQTEQLNQEIQKRDKTIQEQQENFKKQTEQLNQEIQKRDQDMYEWNKNMSIIITEKNSEIENLNKKVLELQNHLRDILNSRGYKIASQIDRLGRKIGIIKK